MKRLLALITLSLATASSFATTYVRVEKDGTKTYSDRPLPGGQPVEIQPSQTYTAPSSPVPAPTSTGVPREQQLLNDMGDRFQYESCALSPPAEQTFTNPESVAVSVTLRPALRAGDEVDLRLDGASVGAANTMSFVAKPVFRGAHTVSVSVKDRYGRSVCEASSTFHVFQPTLNSPARTPPPKPRR